MKKTIYLILLFSLYIPSCDNNMLHDIMDADYCGHSSHAKMAASSQLPAEFLFSNNLYNTSEPTRSDIDHYSINTSWEFDRFGNPNSAIGFNGTDAHVETDFLIISMSYYYISFWIKSLNEGNFNSVLISYYVDTSYNQYGCNIGFFSNNKLGFQSNYYGTIYTIETSRDMNDDKWHHIIFIVNIGTQKQLIYVDNILDKTITTQPPPDNYTTFYSPAGYLTFGARGGSNNYDNYYKGIIDDVRIGWHSLTTEMIHNLYHEGCYKE